MNNNVFPRPKRLYEDVMKEIEKLIINNKLKPGAKLPSERVLAKKFAVSRTTLKEAFRVLESNGIIRSHSGSGRFVRKIQIEDIGSENNIIVKLEKDSIMEFLDAREIIETKIVEVAAEKATDEDIKDIEKYVNTDNRERKITDNISIKRVMGFHLAVARASHNFVFINIMEYHMTLLSKIGEKTRQLEGRESDEHKEHKKILKAIKDHNAKKAKKELLKHLRNVRELAYKIYTKNSSLQKK